MVEIPQQVRRQALHPFRELPMPPGFTRVDRGRMLVILHPLPFAQIVEPGDLADEEVGEAVEEARALVRDHGRSLLIWLVGPEHPSLGARLEEFGLVNEDTPGFEATENGMALVSAPAGERPDGVEIRPVETLEDFLAGWSVVETTFGMPPQSEDELHKRYEEYLEERTIGEAFIALVDGKAVGNAFAAFGDAALNLFGGSVLPEARGRGIYRALTFARWDRAVERGTPALTVQAGKMSMPICERLGFEFVDRSRVFVDERAES